MFYIIETDTQFQELVEKDYKQVFIELVCFNDHVHPALNHISLIYLKPLNNDKGYMLCLNHNESLSLHKTPINNLFATYEEIYVRDRKSFIYFFPLNNVIDISFNAPEYTEPTTYAHDFFYQKHSDKENINTIIPIVKHYEKCELIFEKMKQYCVKLGNSKFYSRLTSVFFAIERNGIGINKEKFDTYFELNDGKYSLQNNSVYTHYNLYTTTGRPSNSFNGINFAALKKDDGCRESFIPKNDKLIEIDINAYHPTLAASLVGYKFENQSPYQYFAQEANIEVSEAKILMFRQLYGGIYKEYQHIEFFQLIQNYVDKLWKEFNSEGFITCSISGHKFSKDLKDMNPQKLFNYVLQNLETSTNVCILWEIIRLLKGKLTKIVLYTYDSILIDYEEEENLLEQIKQIFEKHNLKIKLTEGHNYGKMLTIK